MAENKPDLPQSESFVEAVLVVESSSGVFLVEESLQQTAASEQLPDEEATAGPLPAEQIPGEEAGNIASSGGETFSALPPSEQPPSDEVSNEASATPKVPLLSGPGAIANVVVWAARAQSYPQKVALYGSIALVAGVTLLVLAFAGRIVKVLGRTGINIASRVMGLILAATAAQFIIDGWREAFATAAAAG